jgi:hypothetical protein
MRANSALRPTSGTRQTLAAAKLSHPISRNPQDGVSQVLASRRGAAQSLEAEDGGPAAPSFHLMPGEGAILLMGCRTGSSPFQES